MNTQGNIKETEAREKRVPEHYLQVGDDLKYISYLLAQLKDREKKLAAVEKVRDYLRDADGHVATGEGCTLCTASSELDRILQGGE